ncbi:NUDIX hydrolase [Salinisphaera sp. PC39]|uniref:NUDIX hydrolase n=1 Tax=Salinisphaera sp. PC39 TaxID=1304156 RepID=UPI00333FA932
MSGAEPALADLADRLSRHRPWRLPGRRRIDRAAVAVVLAERPEGLSVLLVRRAEREGDPWSGDMGFPGGRLQSDDDRTVAAACRECREETGLVISPADRIGRLSDRLTRSHARPRPMVVTPYVFAARDAEPEWDLNHEVRETLWLPLAFLADRRNRGRMLWRIGPVPLPMPRYDYRGRRVWGLTLLMLDELVRLYRRVPS